MKTNPRPPIALLLLGMFLLAWAGTAAATDYFVDSVTVTVSSLNTPTPLTSADTILVRNGGTLYVDANATIGTLTVGDLSSAGNVVFNNSTPQTLTVAGDVAFGANAANLMDMTLSVANTIQVGGNFLASGAGTFRAGAATVEYNKTTVQNVTANIGGSGTTIQYKNLILSGNPSTGVASKNFANGASVQGILTITQKAVPSGGSLTYGPLAALVYSGSVAQNTTPTEWPAAPAVLNVPVTINNASGVTLDSDKTIGAVSPNSLTLLAGTLYDNGKTLSVQGNIANATALQGTGVLVLNGSGAQTLTGLGNYGNVTLNNAAGASLPTANATTQPTINGRLTIASGKLKLPNGTTHQTSLLTFGGVDKAAGTYGSTISAAVTKDNGFFDSSTTGILTVLAKQVPTVSQNINTAGGVWTISYGDPNAVISGNVTPPSSPPPNLALYSDGAQPGDLVSNVLYTSSVIAIQTNLAIVGASGSYSVTLNTTTLAIGNYTVVSTYLGGANLAPASSSPQALTVIPKLITVTPRNVTKTYGDPDPPLPFDISPVGGLVGADTFTGSLGRAAGESVGAYAINQGTLSLSANYTLVFTTGKTLTIIPKVITGSYSVPILAGLNLIANQLDQGSNTLNEIMPSVPDGSILYKYNNASGTWSNAAYSAASSSWAPGNLTLNPGEGAFFQSPTNFSLTITGTPHVPILPVPHANGAIYLLSRQTNDIGNYTNIVGVAPTNGATVYRWSGSNYNSYSFASGAWTPSEPTAAVGEAVWVSTPGGGQPPPIHQSLVYQGLTNTSLGNATLAVLSNSLTVGNLGSSGQDGASIALPGNLTSLDVQFQSVDESNALPIGAYIQSQLIGTAGLVTNGVLGTLTMTKTATTNYQMAVDFEAIGATNCTVQAYLNGVLVAQETNVPDKFSATIFSFGIGSYRSIVTAFVNDPSPLGGVGVDFGFGVPIWWVATAPIFFPVICDHLFIAPENVPILRAPTALQIVASQVPSITITSENASLVYQGLTNTSLGNAALAVSGSELVVSNLGSSGQDGVSIALNPGNNFAGGWLNLDPSNSLPVGAYVQSQIIGTAGAVTNGVLGSTQCTKAGTSNYVITADFTPLGSSTHTVQVYNGTNLVAQVTGQTGSAVATLPRIPDNASYQLTCCPWRESSDWEFDVAESITISGGPTVMGTEILMIPEGAVPVSSITAEQILAANIPSITITNESVVAGSPPFIEQQPANLTTTQGGTVTFTVTATGTGPLTYAWGVWCPFDDPRWPDCGCTPTATCSPNLPTLTLTNVSPSQAGGYYVIITSAYGSATSQVATLTVTNPSPASPAVAHVAYGANTFSVSFQSLAGFTYALQYKNALTDPAWTMLESVLATSSLTTLRDTLATGQRRFYRVVYQGPLTGPVTKLEPPGGPPAQPGAPSGCSAGAQDDSLPYLFSGEFHQESKDLMIKGRGMDFAWGRKYRSLVGPNTAQGNGWDFSYNIRVVPNGPNFDVSDGDGRTDTYFLQSDGTYGADQLFCLGTLSSNAFTLEFPDTGRWAFLPFNGSASQGKIGSAIDRNGNSLSFAYDAFGQLTNIVDTLGRNIQVGYNTDGFISSVTDFADRQVTYAYYQNGDAGGSLGDLKSVTSPAVTGTPNGNDFPAGKTVTYTYSTGYADPHLNHKLLTITDAEGQTWLGNTYASTTTPTDFNYGRLLSQTRGYSNEVLSFYYKPQPPIASNGFAVTKAIVNDRAGNVSEYLFDYENRLLRLRQFTGRAMPGITSTETSNRPTGPLRASDPVFFETDYQWNLDSKPTQITFPNGNSVTNTYELALNPNASRRSRGNLRIRQSLPGPLGGDQAAITETFVYDTTFGCACGFNFATQATDGRGNTTYNSYDSHGNKTNTIPPIPSAAESFAWNQYGQRTIHVLPDNGSGYHRTDVMNYYTNGPQAGYLQQSIVDANGLALTTSYGYDTVGNVILITDPRGNNSTNVVNQLNQVVRQISRPVSTANGLVSYQQDTYYDANNNVVQVNVQNINDQGVLQSNAFITNTTAYDILNYPVSIAQEVDPTYNVVTQFAYDSNRNRTLARSGEAANGHQPNNVLSTLYDERNLPFREIRAPGDPGQSTKQSDYDADGNLIRTSQGLEDGAGVRYTIFGYDGFNRRTTTMDAMGNVTTTHYDANGNMASSRVDGELVDVAGSAGNVRLAETTYSNDAMNRRVQADQSFFDTTTGTNIAGGHAISQTAYSPNSQVLKTIDADNHTNSTAYDSANRRSLVTDAKGNTTAYTYDANNNVLGTTTVDLSDLGSPPQTFNTTSQYDAQDRLIQLVDNIGNTTRFAYDSRNNQGTLTDARGNLTRYTYDGLNRFTATTRLLTSNGLGSGTPAGTIVTGQSWDDNSRLTGQTDANSNTTAYVYDTLNRITRTLFADGTTNGVTYDVHDNKTVATDANGNQVNTAYDLLNRATARTITRGPGVQGTTAESYLYDGLSRNVHAQNNDSLVTRSYDSLSHVTRETQQVVSSGAPVHTVACTYDGVGNLLSCAYPGGRVVNSIYDALNRKQTISDALGGIASYNYFGPGRVERRDYGNGTRAAYAYDGIRRMTNSLQTVIIGGALIDSRAYTWDAGHNQTAMNDLLSPTLDARSFSYDSVSRLTQSVTSVTGPTVSYSLDGVGNRLTVAGGSDAGSYFLNSAVPPADFQMNQYTTTPFDARTSDANGNLVSAGSQQFVYDYRNHLVAAFRFDGVSSYTNTLAAKYDCFGRRFEKSAPAAVARYYYSGWQEIEEQDGANSTVATYACGNGIDELLDMDRGGQRRFYHADDLGSVRKVTDATGSVLEQYRYSDYGEPFFFNGAGTPVTGTQIGNSTLFTGRRYDPETGLYYYRTRYLDPSAGRFISRDWIGIWGDGANLGNGCAYVANRPTSGIDPYGEKPVPPNPDPNNSGSGEGGSCPCASGLVCVGVPCDIYIPQWGTYIKGVCPTCVYIVGPALRGPVTRAPNVAQLAASWVPGNYVTLDTSFHAPWVAQPAVPWVAQPAALGGAASRAVGSTVSGSWGTLAQVSGQAPAAANYGESPNRNVGPNPGGGGPPWWWHWGAWPPTPIRPPPPPPPPPPCPYLTPCWPWILPGTPCCPFLI